MAWDLISIHGRPSRHKGAVEFKGLRLSRRGKRPSQGTRNSKMVVRSVHGDPRRMNGLVGPDFGRKGAGNLEGGGQRVGK